MTNNCVARHLQIIFWVSIDENTLVDADKIALNKSNREKDVFDEDIIIPHR